MNIEFKIRNTTITREDTNIIFTGNYNVYKCIFDFVDGSEWCYVDKDAVFKDEGGNRTTVPLTFDEGKLCCMIPDNVLQGEYFKLLVIGENDLLTNNITIGLTPFGQSVNHHIKCKANKGAFLEIFDRLEDKIVNLEYIDNYLNIYSNRGLVDSIYISSGGGGSDCCGRLREIIEQIKLQLQDKADIVHTHNSSDVLDLEDTIGNDFDSFLDELTYKLEH